jgi:hypothetical protein
VFIEIEFIPAPSPAPLLITIGNQDDAGIAGKFSVVTAVSPVESLHNFIVSCPAVLAV